MKYTERGKLLLILSSALYLYSYMTASFEIAVSSSLLLFYVLYRHLLFGNTLRRARLNLTRWSPEEVAFRGHTLSLHCVLESNLPLKVRITQKIPDNFILSEGTTTVSGVVKPGEPLEFSLVLKAVKRGRATLPPPLVEVQEATGIMVHETTAGEPISLHVHASWDEVLRAKAVAARSELEVRGTLQLGFEGLRGDLRKVREWLPGDRLRDVAWKASSRLQKLLTKEFEVEVDVPVVVALDVSRGMRESVRVPSKLDHALNLTLQLSAIFDRRGQPFGIMLYDETRVIRYLRPRRASFEAVLAELLLLPPPSPPPSLLKREGGGVKLGREERAFVETLSPFISERRVRESVPARLTGHYDVARLLSQAGEEGSSVIYITDMSFGLKGLIQGAMLLKERRLKVMVISPKSYLYTLSTDDLPPEELKKAIGIRRARRKAIALLKARGIPVVELSPGQETEYVIKALKVRR